MLHALLTFLLVTFWPLVTSHCNLEQIPGLNFLACQEKALGTPHQENNCEADACASVESGAYKIEDEMHAGNAMAFLPSAIIPAPMPETGRPDTARPVVFVSSPPELSKVWQFSFRAALPVRAPSLTA